MSKKNSSSAGPGDLDGLAGGLGQPGGLDRLLAGALAAETAADEGRDDPHVVRGEAQGLGDPVSGREGGLGGDPDGRLVALDLSQGRVGLDGRMGLVAVEIGLLDHDLRLLLALVELPPSATTRASPALASR